jgi:hypothetical protein
MRQGDLSTFPAFRELRIQDREMLQHSLNRLPPETSDQNFTSLFMWRHNYNIQACRLNGCICLHCAPVEGEFFFPPVGQVGVLEAAETCLAFLKEQGKAPLLGRVPESMVKRHFADRTRFSVSEDRDSFDYVYATEHLVTLSGRSYHGQRNHIRRFKDRHPDYVLEPVGLENVDECRQLAEEWFADKQRILLERPGLSPEALAYEQAMVEDERVAIKEVFAHFRQLPVSGLAVRVGSHIRAFVVGEPLTRDTVVIHLEKADREYHGLGQFICQAFCESVWAGDYQFVNREEDLGFEGLRKAKLALGPHHLSKKYTVTWA